MPNTPTQLAAFIYEEDLPIIKQRVAEERERCARIAEDYPWEGSPEKLETEAARAIAAAIRKGDGGGSPLTYGSAPRNGPVGKDDGGEK